MRRWKSRRGVIGELINGGLDCPVKCLLIPSGSTFVLLMAFQNRYFNITFEKCPLKINSLHCQQSIWPTTGTLGRQQTASSSRKEETYQLLKWYIASTKFNGNTSCKNPLWLSVSLFCQVLPLAYRATHSQTGAVCVFMEDISFTGLPFHLLSAFLMTMRMTVVLFAAKLS